VKTLKSAAVDGNATAPTPVHDARGFWRVLLALVLPVPWLAKGLQYFVQSPYDDTASQIAAWADDDTYAWTQWLDTTFVVLVVPSVVALAWAARRGAPRLSAAGLIVLGGGFLAALSRNINGDLVIWVAARNDYDPGLIERWSEALEAEPQVGLGGLAFIVGIVFGPILLGLALWRSQAVPGWAAAAVGLGGTSHPFLQFEHHVVGVGLWVLAAGCAGVSARLLAMTNDEFDLPPARE